MKHLQVGLFFIMISFGCGGPGNPVQNPGFIDAQNVGDYLPSLADQEALTAQCYTYSQSVVSPEYDGCMNVFFDEIYCGARAACATARTMNAWDLDYLEALLDLEQCMILYGGLSQAICFNSYQQGIVAALDWCDWWEGC